MGPADHFPHFNYADEGPGILAFASLPSPLPCPGGTDTGAGVLRGARDCSWGGGGGDREVHRGSKGEDSFKDFRYCTNAFGQCTVAAPFAVLDFGKTQVPTEGGRLCDCVHPLTKGTAG